MAKQREPELIDCSHLTWVDICEAKPNPMFTEDQRAIIRFLIYSKPVKCAACGKKKKKHWTYLCSFKAADMENSQFVMKMFDPVFDPLTPVCTDHPLCFPKKEGQNVEADGTAS